MDKPKYKNKVKCLFCGDIIESKFRHDFQECKCGKIFVDGGNSYQRIGYPANKNPEECFESIFELLEG